ncbi:MAG: hypothetical protein AAB354_03220 [candidate division KSB1 bacterium]
MATIIIPFVIAAAGWIFSEKHYQAETQRQYLDRVTALFGQLTDTSAAKRALAIAYMSHLKREGQIDSAFVNALVSIASQQALKDSTTTVEARAVADNFPKIFKTSVEKLQPRVFIHYPDKRQKDFAERIQSQLKGAGYDAPGVQAVPGYSGKNELRFFRPEEKTEADSLLHFLNNLSELSLNTEMHDLSEGFKKRLGAIRPRTYELWLRK